MEHGPGRPRRAGVEEAVRAATVRLVRERGYAGTSLDQIAKAASVAKTTVYRRWDSKAELVLDALVESLGELPVPARDDQLRSSIAWLASRISEPAVHRMLVGLVGEAGNDEQVRSALRRRFRDPLVQQLSATWSVEPGAVDLAFDAVVGTLLHHAALAGSIADEVVDAVTDIGHRLLT